MWLGSHKCIWETVVGLILASYVMSGQDAPMKSCQSTALRLSTCIFVSIDPLSASHRTLCPDFCQSSLSSLCVTRERADSVPNLSVAAPWSHRSAPWMQFNTIGTLSSTRASPLLRHIRSPHRSRDWFDSFWCSCKHHKMPLASHKIVLPT